MLNSLTTALVSKYSLFNMRHFCHSAQMFVHQAICAVFVITGNIFCLLSSYSFAIFGLFFFFFSTDLKCVRFDWRKSVFFIAILSLRKVVSLLSKSKTSKIPAHSRTAVNYTHEHARQLKKKCDKNQTQ